MALNDLYQELIIDHGTHPRNCQVLKNPTYCAEGYNPLCGDQIQLYLKIENNHIREASFQGKGCAISTASTSLMIESLIGKTVQEAQQLLDCFQQLLLSDESYRTWSAPSTTSSNANNVLLGKLTALSGVRAYPMRIKCATLPWHALQAALKRPISKQTATTVSTE